MNRSFTWDVGLLRGGGWGEQVKDLQVPALHFRSRSRRAPGRRSPRGAAGVLGPGLRLRVRVEPAAPRLRPLGPRACAVKPRRRPALGRSARERPATPAGQGAPCLPLGARKCRECSEARLACVPEASCVRSPSTKEAASDEGGKGRNVLQRHSPK